MTSVDRSAYELGPRAGPPAVLLHGLTGSPWDLRPLADGLAEQGRRVVAPLLPGHTDLDALAATTWRDWYAGAEDCLARASSPSRAGGEGPRPALLLGFSMGSLLALRLAALRPELVSALVVLAVPIQQPAWQVAGARALTRLRARSDWLAARIGHYPKARSDVRSETVAARRAALPATPYASIVAISELQAEVQGLLGRVRAPTLLLHGAYDHVAPVEGSARVSQALGSSQLRRVIVPRSCHHLARDLDRDRVRAEVLAFAARFVPGEYNAA